MRTILLIATGGTIASRPTAAGGLAPAITSQELLSCVPELAEFCRIDAIQLYNLDSTNMGPEQWQGIAAAVQENYDRYDGFVITHGTDTMGYTAAALSYMIQKSPKPVVLTGSQKSIYNRDTDARNNLWRAVAYACHPDAWGVQIVFDNQVILGTRARKTRTKSFNAFSSIDYPETAMFRDRRLIQFYFGPNHFKTLLASNDLSLSQKDLELEDLVYLGWPIIRWINRWFTIPLFDWLSGWGLSMGIVLLLMTIIVKALVYPATHKSYMSSAKMRVLKPYINEINAKYPKKEDALKKQQETMALYSKYGVSPMGGCLPMLIQMPVFMALFFFVPNAIELRQQSFLWAPDMSTYDDIIHWSTTIPLLGNHLSLFCLLFSITNILNTMYTMKQQDTGQQQMPGMKLMMYIMPVMFIFIFNGYSSGLNYYYFISGLIGILTMVFLRKTTDEKKLLAQLEANKEKKKQKNGGKAGGGLMAKLEALQKEQERLQQERMNKGKK